MRVLKQDRILYEYVTFLLRISDKSIGTLYFLTALVHAHFFLLKCPNCLLSILQGNDFFQDETGEAAW